VLSFRRGRWPCTAGRQRNGFRDFSGREQGFLRPTGKARAVTRAAVMVGDEGRETYSVSLPGHTVIWWVDEEWYFAGGRIAWAYLDVNGIGRTRWEALELIGAW
jgi:hypothetical protein